MKSRLASVRIDRGLDRVDRAVQMLEDEWRRHGDVHLESFWAEQNGTGAVGALDDSVGVLVELVKADLRRRFDAGQRPTAAEYLERFPELACQDNPALSVVYEEFCLCEECDGGADVESFCERYPDWKSSLASQLHCHRMISQAAGVNIAHPKFPKAGEEFEEFQLLSRLGKGGTSRVFLARDISLGGKHVALKVTIDRGEEPKIQGALDHPHIVPVNSVTYQTETRLCGLSMPYQPGLPLDEIIKRVKPSRKPNRALVLWSVLIDGSTGKLSAGSELIPTEVAQSVPGGDGWRRFPASGSYSEGAAWIAMVLARALHYAHGRRIYHRDVKPANVLLTVNHGPQLLDFNLAESPHSAENATAALRGGTLPYMAPEQIEAFLNPERWASVTGAADIYSLGLVLRELLTGQLPDLPKKGVPAARAMRELLDRRRFVDVAVRRFNPAIPPSLEAIVAKCLALSPDDRYSDAESLAKDLERFLNHQPLLSASNPSRRELMGNYLKRQRRRLARASVIAGIVLILGASLARPVREWFTPSFETLPKFQKSVNSIHLGQPSEATTKQLEELVSRYPQACLAKIYLAFALHADSENEDAADETMGKALALADADEALLAWGQTHPEFCPLLVGFADSRILRADELAQSYDQDEPVRDEKRDRELRKPSYRLARSALEHAAKLDPSSQKIQRLLAKAEEVFGDYDASRERLDPVIKSLLREKNSQKDMLFFCRKVRGRAAFLGVEERVKSGATLDEKTLKLVQLALTDLDYCSVYLSNNRFPDGVDHDLKTYRVLHDQARATLTQAEVELTLAKFDQADTHLKNVRDMIGWMCKGALKARLKVPAPISLTKRLEEDMDVLQSRGGFASSESSHSTRERSTKNSPRSG
jgi:serine/threonine protein kinase